MINVGIIGAQTPMAGELIRILVNHPETELTALYSPTLPGRSASSIHPGLIGESIVNLTDKLNPESYDIVFICDEPKTGLDIISNIGKWPELRVVDLADLSSLNQGVSTLATGLSEINRKTLVRGATMASVLPPAAVLPLISLFPLANFLLLSSPIDIRLSLPKDVAAATDVNRVSAEIGRLLTATQSSFNGKVNLHIEPSENEDRGMKMNLLIECNLGIDEIEDLYEKIYDDHNFTFTSLSDVSVKEVVSTQKCVISLNKPTPTTLEITAVADARMRGGAGDAVHVMNLLFGLHEKTGLTLKSSAFGTTLPTDSSSWFA